jgi:hypothetical protein
VNENDQAEPLLAAERVCSVHRTWPVWGAALGAATLAFHLRRRGHCRHCHRS